ncbi:hypothetical protein ACFOEE_19580 [Pseudoalteromonas fenneropenaei]|uniref:DUF2306 domain-containing protein n=1 Tax=Pseudoalteromonas fenneropenaei TaxID=1737459 RepID=A0ABV7CPW7_9GAMM
MKILFDIALYTHIALGCIALLLFWVPVVASKGSKLHNFTGKWYTLCMQVVAGCGVLCSALVILDPLTVHPRHFIDPQQAALYIEQSRAFASFLLMLSFLVLTGVTHGMRVIQDKASRQRLRRFDMLCLYLALLLSSLYTLYLGIIANNMLFNIFATIGILSVAGILRYTFKKELKPREWVIEHLGAMLGSGIGVYTAFSAVGGRHVLAVLLSEQWIFISWIVPSVIGTAAILWSTRYYRSKYRVS